MKKISVITIVLIFTFCTNVLAESSSKQPRINDSIYIKLTCNKITGCPSIPIDNLNGKKRMLPSNPQIECNEQCPNAVKKLIEQNTLRLQIKKHILLLVIKNNQTKNEISMKLGRSKKGEFQLIERIDADRVSVFEKFNYQQNEENTKNVVTILLQDVGFTFIDK